MKINGKRISFGRFPNGELNMPLEGLEFKAENTITWHYSDNEDIFKLAMLSSHMKLMKCRGELYITYLPYSRMDHYL